MLTSYKFSLFIGFIIFILSSYAKVPNLRKCADLECQEKISEGRTTQRYSSIKEGVLSFDTDEKVYIYSKDVGENSELWGVEINGRRGYMPKKFIKEQKVIIKSTELIDIVPTESFVNKEDNSNTSAKDVNIPIVENKSSDNVEKSNNGNEIETEPPVDSANAADTSKLPQNGNTASGSKEHNNKQAKDGTKNNVPKLDSVINENDKNIVQEPQKDANIESNNIVQATHDDDEKNDKEELDNEDEGNGNEGEENGSENKIDNVGNEINRNDPKLTNEENLIEPTHSPPEQEVPDFNDGVPSKATVPEEDEAPVNENVFKTEPSQSFEVVQGTTLYLNDSEIDSPSNSEISTLPLQPSNVPQQEYIVKTTEMPYFLKDLKPIKERVVNEKEQNLDIEITETKKLEEFPSEHSTTIVESVQSSDQFTTDEDNESAHNVGPLELNSDIEIIERKKFEKSSEHSPKIVQSVQSSDQFTTDEDYESTHNVGPLELNSDIEIIERKKLEEFPSEHSTKIVPSVQSNDQFTTDDDNESAPNVGLLELNTDVDKANLEETDNNYGEDSVQETTTTKSNEEYVPESNELKENYFTSKNEHDSSSEDKFQEFSEPKQETVLEINDISGSATDNEGNAEVRSEEQEPRSESVDPSLRKTEEISSEESAEENTGTNSVFNFAFTDPEDLVPRKAENDEVEEISEKDLHVDTVPPSHDTECELESKTLKEQFLEITGAVWSEDMSLAIEGELAEPHISKPTFILLMLCSGTVIVIYLLHMIVVKTSRESPLLEMMNDLDRKQRILFEENNNLKKQLSDSNGQIKSASCSDPAEMKKLKQNFSSLEKKFKEEIKDLEDKNHQLENDLEASTANEMELHRMLDELLASQKETSNFEESVNSLQSMLDSQREVVESLTSDLALKTRLNDELKSELKANKAKTSKLEYQIEQLSHSLEEANISKNELTKKLNEEGSSLLSMKDMNNSLRQEFDMISQDSRRHLEEAQKLTLELKSLKQKLLNKEAECQVSKECLKKVQLLSDGGGNETRHSLNELFNVIEVRSRVQSLEDECRSLRAELGESEDERTTQRDELSTLESECKSLRETAKKLQKEKDEAKAKLDVLTQHYQEKENQLKKELESQEGLLQSVEGSANVVSNRIQAYELELTSCRSQIESLKSELEDQKQSFKIQLTNEERKLHETWLTARAAERRQEELRQENAQLRQKLTQMQKDPNSQNLIIKPTPKRVDGNGSVSSPVHSREELLHSGIPLDLDGSMPLPPPPPHMMPPMFPGRPPLPPGMPPPPHHGLPPPPPCPPHLFGPLPPPPPPPPPDRRLPPAGRIASPTGYDRRSYSPGSDRSIYSDQRYSPGPPATRHYQQRGPSPDSSSKSDLSRRNNNNNNSKDHRSPSPIGNHPGRRSPPPSDRWYTQSPPHHQGASKHRRSPPMDYFEAVSSRMNSSHGQKTSTPLGVNDR